MPGATPRWRGVTLLHEMKERGIPVAVASDNTRDPFYAYGDLDMVEVFREAVRILHLDHPIAGWPLVAARGPADDHGSPRSTARSPPAGRPTSSSFAPAAGRSSSPVPKPTGRCYAPAGRSTGRCRTSASWTI